MSPKEIEELIAKMTANIVEGDDGLPDLTNDPYFLEHHQRVLAFIESIGGIEAALKPAVKETK